VGDLPDVGDLYGRGPLPSAWRREVKNDLRVLRAQKGWSQGDLADALGVSRQSVNALETGKYDPSLPLAFRIARLFGKRVDEIFDDESGGFSKAAE
jgi:putative transcriptional regulator